jgi:capsular polysaccharide biosynthesis protein
VDHRADIYALGVVFYQMLTGELPGKPLQPPSSKFQIDVRLDEVVLRALERKPELRYQQASELKTQIETLSTTTSAGSIGSESLQNRAVNGSENQSRLPSAGATDWSRLFRRALGAGAAIWLLIMSAATLVTFLLPDSYRATARLRVERIEPSTGAEPNHLPAAAYDPYFIQTEIEVVQSEPILAPVIRQLNLAERWGRRYAAGQPLKTAEALQLLKPRLDLRPVRNTTLIEISAFSELREESAELANAIAESYVAFWAEQLHKVNEQRKNRADKNEVSAPPPLSRVEIVDRAVPPVRPARPNRPLNLFFGVVAASVAGLFAAVATALWLMARRGLKPTAAQPPPATPAAVNCPVTMSDWLALLDQGDYARSWETAAPYFQRTISKDAWIAKLEETRRPLGEIRSRKILSITQTVPGSRHVGKFESSFDGLLVATETVTYAKQSDGEWQAIGYLIQPMEAKAKARRWLGLGAAVVGGLVLLGVAYSVWQHKQVQAAMTARGTLQREAGNQSLSFVSLVERVRKELARVSVRFDKLHLSAVSQDGFVASFTGLEAHAVVNAQDAWRSIVGSLAAQRSTAGDQWNFHGLGELGTVRFTVTGLDLDKLVQNQNAAVEEDATLAEQPPVVVETFPVSGAQNIEPGATEIRVRFSKPMTDGSWSWSSAWEDSAPESISEPHYLSDQRTCVMKVQLEPGRTYGWWLSSDNFTSFADRTGLPAVPYLLIFQTKPN